MSVLMPILPPHMFDEDDEMVHCYVVPSSPFGRKPELLLQLCFYILEGPLEVASMARRGKALKTYKID